MGKKKTYEELKHFIEGRKQYILITTKEEFKDKNKFNKPTAINLILKCTNNYYYNISYHNFKANHELQKYHKSNPYTIQNIKLWCKLNNKPFELIDGQMYENKNVKLYWQCLKPECGEIFEASWSDISQGSGCGVCHGKQVALSNCLSTKNPKLASEWHPTKNGNLTPYDVTFCSGQYAWWECEECGHVWEAKISNRANNRGCPECNQSKGEKECKRIFDLRNIYYIPQKEFKRLVGLGNGNLSYDFYLPQCNLLIEYQGEQHERYIKGFHKSKKDFLKQQEHDKRKREYAKSNNIRLLEIWYYDFDNIEEILNKYL